MVNSVAQAEQYGRTHPTRDGGSWNGWCASLCWRSLGSQSAPSYSNATIAGDNSNIESTNPKTAPRGAFHYWGKGDGHVATDLDGGGTRLMMASSYVTDSWGQAIGTISWDNYQKSGSSSTPYYRGWARGYGPTSYSDTGASGGGGGDTVNYHWWELTADAMKAIQQLLQQKGLYSGIDDGDFGLNSVKGTQQLLKDKGLLPAGYVVDGKPYDDPNKGSKYGFALQDWAKQYGYDGAYDGMPGGYTSGFLAKAARAEMTGTPVPPQPEPPKPDPVVPVPDLPAAAGYVFLADIGSSQAGFDFPEYASKGGKWIAIKMGGGNASDSPYVAPQYVAQVGRARTSNMKVIHYWFNGNKNGVTPESSADFFAENADFREGDIAAIDIEAETATNTVAWTPAEAVRYVKQLQKSFPGVGGLFYLSASVYGDGAPWRDLESFGWKPWIASWGSNNGDPGTPPSPRPLIWQYTSKEKVPGNYSGSGSSKVYQDTDGNLADPNLFSLVGWVREEIEIPIPPDPQPEPSDDTRKILKDFLTDLSVLAKDYADLL